MSADRKPFDWVAGVEAQMRKELLGSSDDALAALLAECPYLATDFENKTKPYHHNGATWLRERGVVVLPPTVAEVLRTGEPSEAMVDEAGIESQKWVALDQSSLDDKMRKVLRAALAVLRREREG